MNYYNEFDPKAAAWLRELIAAELIPPGDVDTRSITEIKPHELTRYTQCHFFAGIGGWSLALQLAGWPATRPVWTGSCPCQPFSSAGKQLAQADTRHLWPVFFNLIRECRPECVFGEQVASAAVIGKRADEKAVREVLDRKAVLGVLLQRGRPDEDVLQGLRQFEKQDGKGAGLFIAPLNEARSDTGERGEVSGEGDGPTLQSGSGGHPEPYQSGRVRADGHPVRSTDAEGLELPVVRSDNSGGRLHEGERARGDLCGQRNEPQLGTEPDFEDCGFHQGSAEEEIGRLIGAIGGGAEEAAPVWLDGIQSDLEEAGYTCGAVVMAASSVGAPHIRQRLYWAADATGGQREQRLRAQGDDLQRPAFDSTDGGLANAASSIPDGGKFGLHTISGRDHGTEAGEERADGWQRVSFASECLGGEDGELGDECAICGLDYANECQCPGPTQDDEFEYQERDGILYARRLGDTQQPRLEGHAGHGDDGNQPRRLDTDTTRPIAKAGGDSWSNFDLIPCADGKSRRIEPGTSALAHGIPARVVRLRGYGNAIVPQVAAEFIAAFLEP